LLGIQSNAIKFTRKGYVTINVEIETHGEDQYLKISVEDSGIGIKQQDQKKLFKLFGFLDNHQGMNTNGIGLGLVIANKIVK
jgi:signal transduction histidine kinase